MGKIEKSKEEHLHTTEETLVNNLHDSGADSNKSPKQNFPIVGIGASADGLAAFEAFFSVLPTNTNLCMGFVLVLHLDTKDGFLALMNYERTGDNDVVFPCGWVLVDDEIRIYYGSADVSVSIASAKMLDILEYIHVCS